MRGPGRRVWPKPARSRLRLADFRNRPCLSGAVVRMGPEGAYCPRGQYTLQGDIESVAVQLYFAKSEQIFIDRIDGIAARRDCRIDLLNNQARTSGARRTDLITSLGRERFECSVELRV